jgi:flagellar biosynthesis protein FlhG
MAEIIAIASGKGGVGKSFFAANLSMSFAAIGKNVLLVDGDLGGANLHNFIGLRASGIGLYNFLRDKLSVKDVVIKSPAGIDFIGGSGDVLGMAHINNFEKLRILNQLKRTSYQYVVMDLGAGTSFNMVDFFNYADKKILIMNSEPTSIENSYGFLKVALYRKIERMLSKDFRVQDICKKLRSRSMNFQKLEDIKVELQKIDNKYIDKISKEVETYKVGLILNMLKFKKELNIFYGFENITKKYLSISVEKLGFIPYDISVSDYLKKLKPFYRYTNDRNFISCFDDIRDTLIMKLSGEDL